MMRLRYIFSLFFLITFNLKGQIIKDSQKSIELGTFVSSNTNLPFWSRTNQYGTVPLKGNFLTLRADISKDNMPVFVKSKKIKWGYGLEGVVNIGKVNQILLPQAFLKVKLGSFEFYGGRRKEIVGLVDSSLSSGSLIWSGNTLPMPKIQISIPEYTSIIGKGLISIKGSYAHGWFDNDKLVHSYLHQKTFYGSIGKPSWKLKFYGGFNHQVQWGGKINLPYSFPSVKNNTLPSSISDYIYAVSGVSLNYTTRQKNLNTSQYTSYDLTNRVGNHIGTIDIAAELHLKKMNVLVYRQSVYDDGSLFYLANVTDGLQGVSFSLKPQERKISINKIVVEYLNTTNQGSIVGPESPITSIRGRDNYFNHGQFINGWAYKGRTLGTPFIIPASEIKNSLPLYNIDVPPYFPAYFTNNNRVRVLYLGAKLTILNKYYYKVRIAHSKNYGTYDVALRNDEKAISQTSIENSVIKEFKNSKWGDILFTCNWSIDRGNLLNNSNAFHFSLKKVFK